MSEYESEIPEKQAFLDRLRREAYFASIRPWRSIAPSDRDALEYYALIEMEAAELELWPGG